jgi:hypothetical protein
VHEHPLSGADLGDVDEGLPGRERDEGDGGRLGEQSDVGLSATSAASTAMDSAKVPMRWSRGRAQISSPTWKEARTSAPTSVTIPATSWPRTNGRG